MYELWMPTSDLLLVLAAVLFGLAGVVFVLRKTLFGGSSSSKSSASDASSDLEGKPRLSIFYGTQTGTAQRFSAQLAKDGRRNGFNAVAIDLGDYRPSDLMLEERAIFVVASYGEGEPTDNAREFYTWLMNDAAANTLTNLQFTVFSLGDQTYKHFHMVGRTVDRRLEETGAKRFFARGEGDAHTSLEDDFAEWRTKVWPVLCAMCGTVPTVADDNNSRSYELEVTSDEDAKVKVFSYSETFSARCPYWGKVLVNRELLDKPGDRSTRHIEIETPGVNMRYEAGDHLGVMPANAESLVAAYAARLDIADMLDRVVLVKKTDPEEERALFPMKRTTFRNILTWYVDLSTTVKKEVLGVLSTYATSAAEKERLVLLAANTEEGKAAYQHDIKANYKTLLEVLNECPSVKPDLAHLFQVMPKQQARYYSIASDYSAHARSVHATVAVVRNVSPTGRIADGVCSSFLARLQPGDVVPIFVRKSNFHLPTDTMRPVVMVGPGTGLAPFMGFLHRRRWEISKGHSTGPFVLFFGCRHRDEDFIYRSEIEAFGTDGTLTGTELAFSRDQAHKVYVQHLLDQHGARVYEWLQAGGVFYVCGDARYMAKDVDDTLRRIVQQYRGVHADEAAAYIEHLAANKQYLRDVWSPS